MPFSKSNVLILLPAFNEESVIGKVLADIQKEGYTNVCLIDDGSSDNTCEVARQYGIDIISHPINRGAGAAAQTGITFAKEKEYQYALLMDSDGQHLSQDIDSLITKMEETGADIVIGNRFMLSENSIPRRRIVYNRIANIFTNIFCKKNYSDTQSGFRLLNRNAIESLNLKSRGFDFCSEMIIVAERINLRIEQTPIRVLYTEYSMNKGQNLRVGVRTARGILWHMLFR